MSLYNRDSKKRKWKYSIDYNIKALQWLKLTVLSACYHCCTEGCTVSKPLHPAGAQNKIWIPNTAKCWIGPWYIGFPLTPAGQCFLFMLEVCVWGGGGGSYQAGLAQITALIRRRLICPDQHKHWVKHTSPRPTREWTTSPETLDHRDDALLYSAYVMLIWAAPIPADRWHCSLWP